MTGSRLADDARCGEDKEAARSAGRWHNSCHCYSIQNLLQSYPYEDVHPRMVCPLSIYHKIIISIHFYVVVPTVTKLSMTAATSPSMFGFCHQPVAIPLDLEGHVLSPLIWFFLYQHKKLFTIDRMLYGDTKKDSLIFAIS